MSYTKGPWKSYRRHCKHVWEIVGPKDEAICATHHWLESDPAKESRANAKLICAAPELYEALKEVLDAHADLDSFDRLITALGKGQAALKKAEL